VLREQVAIATELALAVQARHNLPWTASSRRPSTRSPVAGALGAILHGPAAARGDADLAGVKSKLLQRGLYVGKQLMVVYGLARRVPPPTLWQELHAYFRLAEPSSAQ
jgi:hypothetical protein